MKLRFFNIDQKLHRIENMLDYENELTDEQFRNTEDAIRYVDLQIKFLKDEWNITEGAAVDELVNEKQRLIDLIRK